jgi:hypothetical protein
MEVAVTMPSNILERLRWKVGLGLVIVAAGFAATAAPASHAGPDVARSSWGFSRSAESTDSDAAVVDVARSSWGFSARSSSEAVDAVDAVDAA